MSKKYSFLLIFFLISTGTFAQNFNLSGKVLDTEFLPLPHVKLSLLYTRSICYSDTSGSFKFKDLRPGIYQLLAEIPGYENKILSVKVTRTNIALQIILSGKIRHLKEVMIKNRHTEDRKQEESLNLELVNAAFIQRYLGGSLMKTLERLPGIKTIGIGSGQSKPLIRGLGFNRVVVADKGIKHEGQQWGADHGLEIDQFAASEIEVIKGTASFLYGSDAIGGVVSINPPPAPLPNSGGGSIDLIGKSNNKLYGTSLNLYGRNANWFADARITYQRYGDYRVPADSVYIYDYAVPLYKNHLRNTAGKESGVHLNTGYINTGFQSIFYLSNVYSNSGFFANAHGLEPRKVNSELHDTSSRDILMPSQRVNHFKLINQSTYLFSNHQLELRTGYQRNFRQEFSNYVNHGYMPPVYPENLNIPVDLEREFDKSVYSFHLKDQVSLGKHLVSAGVNGEYQDNKINGWSFLVPSFKQVSAGIFLHNKFRLNDRLLIQGAVRYDHNRLHLFEYRDWFSSKPVTNGLVTEKKLIRAEDLVRKFNSFVWSAGLNYNLEQLAIKLNIGKSFRTPIAKELGANGVNYHYFSYERGNPGLSPEQSYQFDASFSWNADQWSVQISPFYNYFPNYIYLNPTSDHDYDYGAGNQVFRYAQSKVIRYGGEVQLKYALSKSLNAEMLFEYLYAKQLSGDKKGYTLPFSPPPSALINLTYSPGWKHQFKDTYVSMDYRITARQDHIVPPEKKTAGYHIVNLQLGTKTQFYGQALSISLQVQNLFDTRYLNHTSFYRLIELPEAGRNLVLSLKIPFKLQKEN